MALRRRLRRIRRGLGLAPLLFRSLFATGAAIVLRAPGQRFGIFGRQAGLRAVAAGQKDGAGLLLTPVHIVRYWEFPFALRNMPAFAGSYLDVGSPRLFSLYVASRRRTAQIRVINPDASDVAETASLVKALGLRNVAVERRAIAELAGETRRYDAIWSISVIEHIPGDGDHDAMAQMYELLGPGGRLLVTVPTDRRTWDEFRERDTYQLGVPHGAQGYFFQHWYDEQAIGERLVSPLVRLGATVRMEWFGERRAGRFAAYEQDWIRRGHAVTVNDPLEIARGYRAYPSWRDMPGQGICGIALTRPD